MLVEDGQEEGRVRVLVLVREHTGTEAESCTSEEWPGKKSEQREEVLSWIQRMNSCWAV